MSALLPRRAVEKLWGCDALPEPFTGLSKGRVGEIWFEPPPELPDLLVKYIFASEKLSVQVHPSDGQAYEAGLGLNGKEECWLVIGAEPGACLGVGFHEELDAARLGLAALDGTIEELLQWHPVEPGDFFFIPPGTVHAIGAGVRLIEVQQNSDITWRLYDYGRPRPLHLDEALGVARGEPHPAVYRRRLAEQASTVLVEGAHFRLVLIAGASCDVIEAEPDQPVLIIPLEGTVAIGEEAVGPGQCGLAMPGQNVTWAGEGRCLVAAPV